MTLLDLEPLEVNLFRNESRDLGGTTAARTLARRWSPRRAPSTKSIPHSLHACFLRRGDMAMPIVYKVDRVRVGRAFAARRVQAIQHGQPILSMVGTFQKWEEGLVHQVAMPRVPPPGS